ncbi:MAG TPA: GDSL-type esterase/lipase family protein [Opitutaceae bacterium]|nr:GDSL-type esterase/lipase family protein [Opitutaceae bacterium]
MKIQLFDPRGFAIAAIALALGADPASAEEHAPTRYRFAFAPAAAASGLNVVKADMAYNKERGYGFEPGARLRAVAREGDPLHPGFVTAEGYFRFSVAVPAGNYRVAVTLGDARDESLTTVKAESRRLMLERVHTRPGEFVTRSFVVNVRTPAMSPGNVLKLDTREMDPKTHEALTPTWDDKLTLEFGDAKPALCALEIEKVSDAITVFVIGDSTVTDQFAEPYGTWAQMLPRWFRPPVAIANHAESGETIKAFRMQGRWLKVMDEMKPGDYVFMQFGHNDPKTSGHDRMWPADDTMGDWVNTGVEANTDYKWLLASYAVEVKRRGGIPVIVSPMTRINITTGALNSASLGEFPKAAIDAAKLAGVDCIDLNAMSIDVATALGPKLAPRSSVDGTHSSTYGGYLLSRCIVEGIKRAKLGLAAYLVDDAGTFDPKRPEPLPDDFKLPLEPRPTNIAPLPPKTK